jgi:predicted NAD-dependent protein-ADP-ribosyltransferase YbiA (DUF1768 family)
MKSAQPKKSPRERREALLRELRAEQNAPDPINVWFGSGENAILSNLSPRRLDYNGHSFRSVEHAHQSLKSGVFDKETWAKYQKAKSVAGLKIPGKPAKIEDGWNVRLMEALLKASFAQDFEAARALKEPVTGQLRIPKIAGYGQPSFHVSSPRFGMV